MASRDDSWSSKYPRNRDYLEPIDFPIASAGRPQSRRVERSLVTQTLERTGWNQSRAATSLGVNRDQIRWRIEKFGLTHK
jgi:transcriptional regulator with GAF, ATPase, and Fis domain